MGVSGTGGKKAASSPDRFTNRDPRPADYAGLSVMDLPEHPADGGMELRQKLHLCFTIHISLLPNLL